MKKRVNQAKNFAQYSIDDLEKMGRTHVAVTIFLPLEEARTFDGVRNSIYKWARQPLITRILVGILRSKDPAKLIEKYVELSKD